MSTVNDIEEGDDQHDDTSTGHSWSSGSEREEDEDDDVKSFSSYIYSCDQEVFGTQSESSDATVSQRCESSHTNEVQAPQDLGNHIPQHLREPGNPVHKVFLDASSGSLQGCAQVDTTSSSAIIFVPERLRCFQPGPCRYKHARAQSMPSMQVPSCARACQTPTSETTCSKGHRMIHMSGEDPTMPWLCDSCAVSSEDSIDGSRWRCSDCDYDLCKGCEARWQRPATSVLQCPGGHKLKVSLATSMPWDCGGCARTGGWAVGSKRYTCLFCGYDRCNACQQKPPAKLIHPLMHVSEELQDASDQKPHPRCTQGHLLAHASGQQQCSRWICDNCGLNSEESAGSSRWRCAACNYDLCQRCEVQWQIVEMWL